MPPRFNPIQFPWIVVIVIRNVAHRREWNGANSGRVPKSIGSAAATKSCKFIHQPVIFWLDQWEKEQTSKQLWISSVSFFGMQIFPVRFLRWNVQLLGAFYVNNLRPQASLAAIDIDSRAKCIPFTLSREAPTKWKRVLSKSYAALRCPRQVNEFIIP